MTKKQPAEARMESTCVSLGGPARQFARVDLVGKAQSAHNAAWEAGHLGDVGYPAQQESLATSFVKAWAASFKPSTVVR